MATLTSPGIGSGLDIKSLVSSLMAVESKPLTVLATTESSYLAKLTAFGTLKGQLSTLQDAASAMATDAKVLALSGSLADGSVGSVTVTNSAKPASLSVEVKQLATAQKLTTGAVATSTQLLSTGTGSITFDFGTWGVGDTFTANATRTSATVNIAADKMSLSGIRDAINSAGIGVSASVLNDGSGARLLITNDQTGVDQSMRISVADPDGSNSNATGLSMLAYDRAAAVGSGENMQQLNGAQDAQVLIDNAITVNSKTNTFNEIVDGVSLTVSKTNIGSPTTLAISNNTSTLRSSLNTLVNAYNSFNSNVRSLTNFDASTKKGSTLTGDSAARSLQSTIRTALTNSYGSGAVSRLNNVGVTFQTDGSLKLDETKFNAAFAADPEAVRLLFTKGASTDGNGLAGKLRSTIASAIGSNGILTSRTEGINTSLAGIAKQRVSLQARLDKTQQRLSAQFNALDSTVATQQALGSYLTQQLSAINNFYSNNK